MIFYYWDDIDKGSSDIAAFDVPVVDHNISNQLQPAHCFPFRGEVLAICQLGRALLEGLIQPFDNSGVIIQLVCSIQPEVLCVSDVLVHVIFVGSVVVEVQHLGTCVQESHEAAAISPLLGDRANAVRVLFRAFNDHEIFK